MPAIRSDSLWRSSPAPRITVVPRGLASRPGRGPGSRRSPRRRRPGRGRSRGARDERTTRSAIGSPTSVGIGAGRRRRPLLDVGAHRAQDVDDRAARRVDADVAERQLGVRVDRARDEPERGRRDVARDPLLDRLHRHPSFAPSRPPARPARPSRSTGTPRARSIRSVWSRVATASRTVVRPSARSPARRIADFTCALGTGRRDVDRPERGATDHGQRREGVVRRAWSTAPIERSGSMIRATGRRRNESSPSRTRRHRQSGEDPGEQPQARPGVAAVEDRRPARAGRRRPGETTR